MKSKLIKALVTGLIVVGIGFGGFYGYKTYFVKSPVVAASQYYTTTVKKMNLSETIQGTGSAYAASTKDVSPSNAGTLQSLSVKVGDTVTAGQTLFVSDSDDLRKAVTTAQNNLTKVNLTLTSDQADLATAQTDLASDPNNTSKQKAVQSAVNKVAQDKISVSDAKTQLSDANKQLSKMTVTAPIGGIVTAVNNSNGDILQSGKSVLTVVDMSSMKIKISVDELDISKVKTGQKATIKFDAISGKSYEGAVETIAQTGTTSNSVTTYEVILSISDPTGIKLGMNANVTIQVESKENALVIPAEALVESNGQKFVRVESTDTSAVSAAQTTQNAGSQTSVNNQPANGQASLEQSSANKSSSGTNAAPTDQQVQNTNGQSQNTQRSGQNSTQTKGTGNSNTQASASSGKLVAIKTGLETSNYIEVTEGLTEGQKVLIQLPSTSSSSSNKNSQNGMMGAGFGGDMGGQMPPSGGPKN